MAIELNHTIAPARDKVASTRLMLSSKGLPTSGSVGYEIFDNASALGQTDFVQNLNRQRALEGELARTIRSLDGVTFARGTRVEMEFDEDQFVGGGVFLFASVVERFLGEYVSLNSFSQLVARTRQRKEILKEWPPRAGQVILL